MAETEKSEVRGQLKERDGVPLLVAESDYTGIKGFLITFKNGTEEKAYSRIVDVEPEKVYRWGEVSVNEQVANVLYGKKVNKGGSDLPETDWDGRNDPFFKEAIGIVEKILKENSESFNWKDFKPTLRLQMAYTLLWSAIERYAGLKYHLGERATEKVLNIAQEKSFKDNLKKIVKEKRRVHSTTNLKHVELNPDNPKNSLLYYYQVRSNAVHRGKVAIQDFETVRKSLKELLEIFKHLLDDSFNQGSNYECD